jgi:CelD/BcsL family acetyltransferase involved in cellulose biosynthesis
VTNTRVANLSDFCALKNEWKALELASQWKSIFSSHEFVQLWYECFASPESVRVYRIADNGETLGFLPLVFARRRGTRMLKSLTNPHCPHNVTLCRTGHNQVFEVRAMECLVQDRSWDFIFEQNRYSFVPSPALGSVAANATQLHRRERTTTDYAIVFPRTFDEYFGSLPSKLKKKLRGSFKRLEAAGEVRVVNHQNRTALASWSDFLRLEDSGWKGQGGSSIRRLDASYQRYYERFLDLLSARGELSLYLLELNGKAIAGALGYTEGDVFHWFKTGYDEQFHEFSPSHRLMFGIVEDLIETRPDIHRFHMFPDDFGYKHRYANENPVCHEMVLYNRTLGGTFARLLDSAVTRFKAMISRVPGQSAASAPHSA